MTELDQRHRLADAGTERRDALAARLLSASVEALELFDVYIGDRLGLYRALADHGPLDAAGLAAEADVSMDYALEWLEQQAVAGVVAVADDQVDERWTRRFSLPPGHAEVLLDGSSLNHLVPLAMGAVGVARALPEVLDAFVSGGGVPSHRYGPDLRWSTGRLNRPLFFRRLGRDWLSAVHDVDTRLRADPPALVADLGCGTGWSAIAIALAYPRAIVHGFDTDAASVAEAKVHAAAHGVADRVTFPAAEAAAVAAEGAYDVACAFAIPHPLSDPAGVLAAMRHLVGNRGAALLVNHHVSETFTAPGDEWERFQHGWSTLYRLPSCLAVPVGSRAGEVLGPGAVRRLAEAAGFDDLCTVVVDGSFRLYRFIQKASAAV